MQRSASVANMEKTERCAQHTLHEQRDMTGRVGWAVPTIPSARNRDPKLRHKEHKTGHSTNMRMSVRLVLSMIAIGVLCTPLTTFAQYVQGWVEVDYRIEDPWVGGYYCGVGFIEGAKDGWDQYDHANDGHPPYPMPNHVEVFGTIEGKEAQWISYPPIEGPFDEPFTGRLEVAYGAFISDNTPHWLRVSCVGLSDFDVFIDGLTVFGRSLDRVDARESSYIDLGALSQKFVTGNTPTVSFTISLRPRPKAPMVDTLEATEVTYTAATLQGQITNNAKECECWFTYWTEGGTSFSSQCGSGLDGPQAFSATISELLPGTTYFYQAHARNDVDSSSGNINTFTTSGMSPFPKVEVRGVTNIDLTRATLQGRLVNDGGESCRYRFIWWKEGDSDSALSSEWVCCVNVGATFSQSLSELEPGSKYRFRIEVSNSHGNGQVSGDFFTADALYVRDTSDPLENGSIDHPFDAIQEAIDAAHDGDVVIALAGLYRGPGNRDIDFRGRKIRVRSVSGPNTCIIDCEGTGEVPHRAFHFQCGEDANSVVQGFTILNGCAPALPGIGGGIYAEHSSPLIASCIFLNNTANGGGAFCGQYSSAVLRNCVMFGNTAGGDGGGAILFINGSDSPEILNCTIVRNSCVSVWGKRGGGLARRGGKSVMRVVNTIFSDNVGLAVYEETQYQDVVLQYCCFFNNEGGDILDEGATVYAGGTAINQNVQDCRGNIDGLPRLVDLDRADWHVLPSSPCIDAGDPNSPTCDDDFDIDGDPRVIGDAIDIGADECLQIATFSLAISSSAGGSVTIPGEGFFVYENPGPLTITASPQTGYEFVGWTGSAVEAGKVADPNAASTTVTVDADYVVFANFTPAEGSRSASPVVGESWVVPDLEMTMRYVEPGTFQMGSNSGGTDEKPVHTVQISKGFWMGECEVTQFQYQTLMGTNPSHYKGSDRPVERISWHDASAFCEALTQRERAAGRLSRGYSYRLPTEAQWEYAARGGTKGSGSDYPGSNDLGSVAWYSANSTDTTHPVGQKAPNELGLHDMSGNVSEWCSDWYGAGYYASSPQVAPQGPASGTSRVYRGGGHRDPALWCRCTARPYGEPTFAVRTVGMRVVLGSD